MGGVEGDHRVTGCAKRASSLEGCDPWKITAVPRRSRVGRSCESNVSPAAARNPPYLKRGYHGRAKSIQTGLDFGGVLAGGVRKRILAEPG